MTTRLYFVHALSPLHAGTGQGSGVIDLPIAREKATGIPYLPGSSVKGVLRDKAGESDLTYSLFGPTTANASDHAGSLQLADARLLLLPVRSLRGTFAWVTSPYLLRRIARDAADAGVHTSLTVPTLADGECDVIAQSALKLDRQQVNAKVMIEDLDLTAKPQQAQAWADWLKGKLFPSSDTVWPTLLAERLCIVSDDVFSFLLTTAIEVIARNRLEDTTKTVAKGALWYEEALPAETVLYGLATITPSKQALIHYRDRNNDKDFKIEELVSKLNEIASGSMQFGGKATVGRGLCRVHLLEGGK